MKSALRRCLHAFAAAALAGAASLSHGQVMFAAEGGSGFGDDVDRQNFGLSFPTHVGGRLAGADWTLRELQEWLVDRFGGPA